MCALFSQDILEAGAVKGLSNVDEVQSRRENHTVCTALPDEQFRNQFVGPTVHYIDVLFVLLLLH